MSEGDEEFNLIIKPIRSMHVQFKDSLTKLGLDIIQIGTRIPFLIRWSPPMKGHYKLNIDGAGASAGNPGNFGFGEVLRDYGDKVIFEFSQSLGVQSDAYAEVAALRWGLPYCYLLSILLVSVEIDSQVERGWFERGDKVPWCIESLWEDS